MDVFQGMLSFSIVVFARIVVNSLFGSCFTDVIRGAGDTGFHGLYTREELDHRRCRWAFSLA